MKDLTEEQKQAIISEHPCAGSAGTGERAFSVSEYSALRAGIFKASGSIDPM